MIGSLFSGIGGLELGLEWAGFGPTVWQVEKDEFCRGVLARHWPSARRFEDVCTVGAHNLEPVDLICGGFPCQDVSAAGKGAGLEGDRSGLWYEFLRVVRDIRPAAVVVENVASGATRWVDAVVAGLESAGYQCLPVPLRASDCGAWHRRGRVFIVAYANGATLWKQPGRECGSRRTTGAAEPRRNGTARPAAYAVVERSQGTEPKPKGRRPRPTDGDRHPWQVEPPLGRVADGVPDRMARLRALGNAVVPQCAQVVGEVLAELLRRAE